MVRRSLRRPAPVVRADGADRESWFFSDNVYSNNHPMFGSAREWMHKCILGIDAAPDAVGYDRYGARRRGGRPRTRAKCCRP